MTNIYCPKCGGENIEKTVVSPSPKKLSIDEVARAGGEEQARNYVQPRYKLVCKDCGYSREYGGRLSMYGEIPPAIRWFLQARDTQ